MFKSVMVFLMRVCGDVYALGSSIAYCVLDIAIRFLDFPLKSVSCSRLNVHSGNIAEPEIQNSRRPLLVR
jgi:hypothetical protein